MFDKKTDLPYYDSIIFDKEDYPYFFFEKKIKYALKEIPPLQYMSEVMKMQKSTAKQQFQNIDKYNLKKLFNGYKSGRKFPSLILDYKSNSQEGRHRALIAYKEKEKTVPVYIFEDSSDDVKYVVDKIKNVETLEEAKKILGEEYPLDARRFMMIKNDYIR